jgi:hypothetical protein
LRSKWLIFIPVLWFALFSKPAKAEVLGEWTYSQSCATGSVEVIEDTIILHGPDGGGCQGANWVKIVTTIPADVNTIDFTWAYQTYDGAWYDPPQVGVNGVYTQLTNSSNATGSVSISVNEGDIFTFRQYSTDSCCQPGHLTISNLSLWAYITASTTTTTTTTTTVPPSTVPVTVPTTTTVQETTTTTTTSSTSTTTTTVPQTTTSVENSTSTTSTTSTTSSTTTSTSAPQTTTTESTTTTTQPPPSPAPTPPQTTQPVPVETSAPTTLPETTTSTTSTTVTATTTTVTLPATTTSTTSTSSLPPATTIAPQSPQTTLPAVLSDVTPTQALSVALAPETLQTLTASQANEIFASLPVNELSDTQIAEITEAVQNAPTEVRQAFEEKVDIFKAGFDDYVPVGSNIPVGTRRTLIAVTAGITLAAAGTRMKR